MGSSEKYLIRPGALIIFFLALVVGLSVFNWSGSMLERTGENSDSQRQQALECSTLELDFVDLQRESGNYTVFFQVNKHVRAVAVTLDSGDRNVTKIVEEPPEGSLNSVTAEMEQLETVQAVVAGCDRVFTR